MKKIAVMGGSGFLGRLVADQVLEAIQGKSEYRLVLGGRDRLALERVSMDVGRRHKAAVDIVVCTLQDRSAVRQFTDGCSVVISCVAPYSELGGGLIAAAAVTKAHVVDASFEPAYYNECKGRDASLKESGITVVHGLGVRSALADAAAEVAAQGWQAAETAHVLYMFHDLAQTPGWKKCYLQNLTNPLPTWVGGQITDLDFGARKRNFSWPGGGGKGVFCGGGESFQLPRHLKALQEVYTYNQVEGLKGMLMPVTAKLVRSVKSLPMVRKWATERIEATTDGSVFAVVVELEARLGRRFAVLQGRGVYNTTARLLARGALRLATEPPTWKGIGCPCEVFGPDWVLKTAGVEPQMADAAPA